MAKVKSPLFSTDARGTLGKTITFMKRGPTAFVRKVVKPVQRWYGKAVFSKYIQGGTSTATGRIQRDWIYYAEILKLGVAKSKFQGQLIAKLKSSLFQTEAALQALWLEMMNLPLHSWFFSQAKKRGFQDLPAAYWKKVYMFDTGFQLYMLGYFAVETRKTYSTIFNFWPYTLEIEDWGETEIQQHAERVRQAPP